MVHIDPARLPACQIDGKLIHTTAPAVHAALSGHFGEVDFATFCNAFFESHKEVTRLRATELREIQSQERFRLMLKKLGMKSDRVDFAVLDSLTRTHMTELQRAFEVRPETMKFLEWARPRFRIAMISNLDYAPVLYETLDRFGIRTLFETITVSAEIGWRKPHPLLFERTLANLKIDAKDALFVGDQLYIDVQGALNSGMDVVWLKTEVREGISDNKTLTPTYTVESITEIINLLEQTS